MEGSEKRFNPVLTPIKDTFFKKIGLQKCKKVYLPAFDDSMFIASPIPQTVAKEIDCERINVPFTVNGIWEALMLHVAELYLDSMQHGNYHSGDILFSPKGLAYIDQWEGVPIPNVPMIPGVEINGHSAVVTYYTWKDSEGLTEYKETILKTDKGVKWVNKQSKIILRPRIVTMY